jgi:hypothetical protein
LFEEINEGAIDLAGVERLVREAYEPYRAMLADIAVYADILGIEAARMFLVGVDGLDIAFQRDKKTGVPDPILARIDPFHLRLIGAKVEDLMKPNEEEEKNSESPSSGSSDRKTSPEAKT